MNGPARLVLEKESKSAHFSAPNATRRYARELGHEMRGSLRARIVQLLDAHHVMSLATVGADGPHAVNLFYVRDEYTLIWVSDPASRHSCNIEARAAVAATIARDCCDFPEVQGLQIRGRASRIGPREAPRARSRLEARYPFLQGLCEEVLRDAYERAQLYRLEPERIVLIDNQRGFGSKEVLAFRASA